MVYFKLEFSLGKKNKCESKTNPTTDEPIGWDVVKTEVEQARRDGRFKTATNYLTAVRSWTQFVQTDRWRFSSMTSTTLERYQRWLGGRGLCLNTVSAYLRSLRTLYHKAISDCRLPDEYDPFRRVFTGRAKTMKRSIPEESILQLSRLELPAGSSLCLARDIFLFSFYAMGMPFVDVAYLKKNNLKDGLICYARHKTGQPVRVSIEQPLLDIINRYMRDSSDFVFPILSSSSPAQLNKQYQNALRRYNYHLRRLSTMIDVPRPLSSYVVRHSWASLAYQHHVDVSMIGRALGHTKSSTTLLYIRELFDPDLASANRKLMEDIGL